MESVCICGPSPFYLGPYRFARRPSDTPDHLPRLVHRESGWAIHGLAARYLVNFMTACGVLYESLDRRTWVWTSWAEDDGHYIAVEMWPDPRSYPYPASARR